MRKYIMSTIFPKFWLPLSHQLHQSRSAPMSKYSKYALNHTCSWQNLSSIIYKMNRVIFWAHWANCIRMFKQATRCTYYATKCLSLYGVINFFHLLIQRLFRLIVCSTLSVHDWPIYAAVKLYALTYIWRKTFKAV